MTGGAGRRHGPVLVGGPEVLDTLPGYGRGRRCAIISTRSVEHRAVRVGEILTSGGSRGVHHLWVPDGEKAKSAEVLVGLWEGFAQAGLGRDDLVVCVGGGSVTDLGGFAAATWMRGVEVIHHPTTVLAMVDAALGGKTGIDTAAGKNLVGAFHLPSAVLCDLSMLSWLDEKEIRSGLAEVLKAGFLGAPGILDKADMLTGTPDGFWWAVDGELHRMLASAIALKLQVVEADPRESDRREHLNYGHTIGHALESLSHRPEAAPPQVPLRHGEAVAIGMVAAAEIAVLAGLAGEELPMLHRTILRRAGLPISHQFTDVAAVLDVLGRDKKARGGQPRFVLLREVGDVVVHEVDHELIVEALHRTGDLFRT